MRHFARRATVVLFGATLGMTACVQPEAEMSPFSDEDVSAVRANLERYMSADPIQEPEAFFSQFAEDVYWIYDQNPPWVGMEALRSVEWCGTISGEVNADRVEGSGDLAYARGTYNLTLDCGEAEPVASDGVFLSAHRRQVDGTWRIESLLQVARGS